MTHQLTNQEAKELRQLHLKKYRDERKLFLVESEKVVAEAEGIEQVIVTEALLPNYEGKFPVAVTSEKIMTYISELQTPPGVIAVVRQPSVSLENVVSGQKLAVFIDISDPGNLGTMIRTADWFGLDGIILSAGCVDHYNEKVVRASMGSLFHLPIYRSNDPLMDLKELKNNGHTLIATDVHGEVGDSLPKNKICLLMGSEAHGLDKSYLSLADQTYTIPKLGSAESLNVAVSFGIVLSILTIPKN